MRAESALNENFFVPLHPLSRRSLAKKEWFVMPASIDTQPLKVSQNNMADFIKIAEEAFATGKQHPAFKAGDTITVAYKIVEGNKERIQLYRGVVIKISGHGDKRRFTVRKMSGTVGVERIFPIDSPNIDSIQINKVGKVRRAKLYYLRNLTGKKARIAEKRMNAKEEE
jgi:large subunit ribosomal protein L19